MNENVAKVLKYIVYSVKIGPGFANLLKDINKNYWKHFAIVYVSPNVKLHSQYSRLVFTVC